MSHPVDWPHSSGGSVPTPHRLVHSEVSGVAWWCNCQSGEVQWEALTPMI